MLETIRKAIDELPKESFTEFYGQYVMDTQDRLINQEIELSDDTKFNFKNTVQIVCKEFERLKEKYYDKQFNHTKRI